MSQQKNSISINEHALKREPVPLNHLTCENSPLSKLLAAWDVSSYETTLVVRSEEKRLFSQAINHLFSPSQIRDRSLFITGGRRILVGITSFLGEQKGGSVVTENPKGGIAENFGRIQRGITQMCLENEDMGAGEGGGKSRKSSKVSSGITSMK